MRIISDCNTVFIAHMLAAARASSAVSHVITNFASFCRVSTAVQVSLCCDASGSHSGQLSTAADCALQVHRIRIREVL